MKKSILCLVLFIISLAFVHADVYVKSVTHNDAIEMMGQKQPARDINQEQWLAGNKMAVIMPEQTTVLDLDVNKMYIIYPGSKTYVETELPFDLAKILPPQAAQMLSMMKVTAKVTPTGETKQVDKWSCKGYNVDMNMSMMQMSMKVWATQDVPFDFKAYQEKIFPYLRKISMGAMNLDDATLNEFKKIDGFQVLSEVSVKVMGTEVKSYTKVLEISEKPAPAAVFTVPAGFTKQDKMNLQGGM